MIDQEPQPPSILTKWIGEKLFMETVIPAEDLRAIARQFEIHSSEVTSKSHDLAMAVVKIFSGFKFHDDFDICSDVEGSYAEFNRLIDQYQAEEITKHYWAETLTVGRMDFSNRFSDIPDKVMKERATFLKRIYEERGNFEFLKKMVADSELTDGFWKTISYIWTARSSCLVKRTCNIYEFEEIFAEYFGRGAGNDSIPRFNCTLDLSFDPKAFITDLTTCFNETNMERVGSLMWNKTKQDIVSYMRATKNIEKHLSEYLTKWKFDADFYRRNFVGIQIYYNDMSREILVQNQAYNVWSLFCDIGGTLGLFLGASVITFAEILDLLLCQIWKRVSDSLEEQRVSVASTRQSSADVMANSQEDMNELGREYLPPVVS